MITSQAIQKISRDILQLRKDPIDGIEIVDPDSLSELKAIIHAPNSTPYENGQFVIRLQFGMEFPQAPPKAYFLTKIFHPNIDAKTGEICVNTLKRDWKASLGLRHVLLVIRCLMIEPNPDSALNAEAGHMLRENYDQFVSKAKMFTQIHAQKRRVFPEQHSFALSSPSPHKKKSASSQMCHSGGDAMPLGGVIDSKENNRNSSNTSHNNTGAESNNSALFDGKKDISTSGDDSPNGIMTAALNGAQSSAAKKAKKVNKKKRGLRRL
mmetsp:Transcript_10135/g.37724  ORF Transcript_10135/g.37724 Transcript_10135/m.37724 type:complete len:267 (-) Transcript_10135:2355-3155(-)